MREVRTSAGTVTLRERALAVRYEFDAIGFVLHALYDEDGELSEITEAEYDLVEVAMRSEYSA